MKELNLGHFYYFWLAVREGGIQAAARQLGLKHPTLSTQIRRLEEELGCGLLNREGRRIRLTDDGKVAYEYADKIFGLSREFLDVIHGHSKAGRRTLKVGITDAMPKLIVRHLLEPAFEQEVPVRLELQHDRHDRLIAELAINNLDLVLADAPSSPSAGVRAFNHELGRSGLSFFAHPTLKHKLKGPFPQCLDHQPFLAPAHTTALGRNLEQWLSEAEVHPDILAEFEDSALLKTFGAAGVGAFAVPSVMEREVMAQYGVEMIGRTSDVEERFYAISLRARLKDPAVKAICEKAREYLSD